MMKSVTLSLLSCTMLAGATLARLIGAETSPPTGVPSEDSGFKPVVEAPLPEGFPTYTPVGKIEVKHYPAYRKAETSGRVAFWTLFEHISSAGVEMTAPVEMTYRKDGPPVGKEQSMAFLYGNRSIGTPGQKGNVEVVDVPAATVVSFGARGRRSDEALVQAEKRLREWIAASQGKYEQNGPVRVMGYNSPFVASDRQFYEVQIPVREASGLAAK